MGGANISLADHSGRGHGYPPTTYSRPDRRAIATGPTREILAAVALAALEWKIPVEEREGIAGQLEHIRAQVFGVIGGQAMSKFFDCGGGFSGNNAPSKLRANQMEG